jgi:glycosyltransferase involved in cell wall biosynthesis
MNICLVSTGYPPEDGGGIGTYISNLAQGLKALGHNIFVITQTRNLEKEEVIYGISVYRAKSRYIPWLENYFPGLAWSIFVSRKIKELDMKYGIDLIEFPNWEGVGFCYLLRKKRKPAVTRLHTPYFETLSIDKNKAKISFGDKFTCWMEKTAVRKSDFLTSSTECHKSFMEKAYQIDMNRIKLLPLGIQLLPLKESPLESPDVLKVLYVSRLEKRKGTLTLLEAVPEVIKSFPNVEFIFIGKDRPHAPNGKYFREYFFEEFKDYSSRVKFLGYVSNEELRDYYYKSDIFVVPSVYESFGLIYIEAMAYGKPAIGCGAGGIQEVIVDGVTGFLVPPSDSGLLAQRILELLKNEKLRLEMGKNGRKRAESMFSRDKMVKRTADLYLEAITDRIK